MNDPPANIPPKAMRDDPSVDHQPHSAVASPATESSDDEDSRAFMSTLEHESDDLWMDHPLSALLTLTLPLWLSGTLLLAVWAWHGAAFVRRLVVAAATTMAAGRFVIWGGDATGHPLRFSAVELALLVLYLDMVWAVVLTWHAGALFHLPWVGNRLRSAVQEGSQLIRQHRWMRNLTVGAVLAFVMLPVSSTGSIGGSLLGRLLGLSRNATFLVVLVGSLMGCGVMLGGAGLLEPFFRDVHPLVRYGGIALVVLIGFVLSRRYRRSIAR